jgi:hypothetical protein
MRAERTFSPGTNLPFADFMEKRICSFYNAAAQRSPPPTSTMVYRPKLCFVLMPFGRPFDSYYEKIIKPAAAEAT